MTTLGDLGERAIVRDIVPEYCSLAGDDCALVSLPGRDIVVTTDPVPEPAAKLIGNDPDPYWMGWLLVVINLSDLAVAGAQPICFVAAIEAPPELPVEQLRRFLAGIADACREEGVLYAGGNLRERDKLHAVGTAVGQCAPGRGVSRHGAAIGDVLVSVGDGGPFWRDALLARQGHGLGEKEDSPLFRPRSQSSAMRKLAEARLVKAAIDNSDGLLPSLAQLAKTNCLGVRLDLDSLPAPAGSEKLKIDPVRLWLGWGDWNVVAAIQPEALDEVRTLAASAGSSVTQIGVVTGGDPAVTLRRGEKTAPAPRLESERFAKDSWFSSGLDGYIDLLLSVELP